MKTNNTNPSIRHDALLLFDAVDSNPNGDPDNAGKPRVDLETQQGLVSDVSLKRKIRDAVTFQVEQEILPPDRNKIFIRRGVSLNEQLAGQTQEDMIEDYFDVRMFGAVMTTGGSTAGKVTGPVTVGIARSVDPVLPIDLAITRVASTKEENRDNASQMGNKTVIPYGLYVVRIHYQPTKNNHVTEDDLSVLWNSIVHMFEWSRSAARPDMSMRGLFGFTHENALGNAPAHKLFEMVDIHKVEGVETPVGFDDYVIAEPALDQIPAGVTYWRLG